MNCLIIVYDYESCDCNQEVYLDKTLTGKDAFFKHRNNLSFGDDFKTNVFRTCCIHSL